LKLLSYFKGAISEQQMRKKEYQSHFRLRKKCGREKMWGVMGIVHDDMICLMGFKWIQEDLGKMSPIKLSNLFTVFKPSLNSLSMGGAAHIHGICPVS